MLPASISSFGSDKSSEELLPPTLLITSSSSSDSSINCFFETFFSDLDFFSSRLCLLASFRSLQHRLLRNNLNKKLHHCTVTNRRANMNSTWVIYLYACIHILYVHIYINLVPRTFCLFNIGRRERSRLPISERQNTLGMRLYI